MNQAAAVERYEESQSLADKIFARIKDWHVLVILLAFALWTSYSSNQFIGLEGASNFAGWWEGFWQNFSTELYGAFMTFLLIEVVVGAREKQRAATLQLDIANNTRQQLRKFIEENEANVRAIEEEAEKKRLILQMGSPFNESAIEASRQLRSRGWLTDGSLQGAELYGANLRNANLREINLQKALLSDANLQKALLSDANLQAASLREANLYDATLGRANLQEADLYGANLQAAYLWNANLHAADMHGANLQMVSMWAVNLQAANLYRTNLQRANLHEANLQAANLEEADFDGETRLPDGSFWTPRSDLARFTDSDHPSFWRSDNSKSPAFKGADNPNAFGHEEHIRQWPKDSPAK